jgi:hypothetical protein
MSAAAVSGAGGSGLPVSLTTSGGGVATIARGGAGGSASTAGRAANTAGAAGRGGGKAGTAIAGSGARAGSPVTAGVGGTGRGGTGGVVEDECGAIPTGPQEAATPKAVVLYALVEYHTSDQNQFVGVHATLTVPAKPPPTGVIFVWPGTQTFPTGSTVQPVGEGVLQPVLTWGQSCVPGALAGHSTWWISPVYVNDVTSIAELNG